MSEENSTCEPDYTKLGKKPKFLSKQKKKTITCPICGDHQVEVDDIDRPVKIDKTAHIYEPVHFVETNHEIVIGKNCSVGQFTFIGARRFHMAEGSQVNPQSTIGGGGDVYLHKFAVVGFGARLFPAIDTADGKYMSDSKPESERAVVRGSIHVGEGAYIGANAVISVAENNPDIHIGKFAVIGAGCYIDRDVPEHHIIHSPQERGHYLISQRPTGKPLSKHDE